MKKIKDTENKLYKNLKLDKTEWDIVYSGNEIVGVKNKKIDFLKNKIFTIEEFKKEGESK
jgi:predicted RNA-binding protein